MGLRMTGKFFREGDEVMIIAHGMKGTVGYRDGAYVYVVTDDTDTVWECYDVELEAVE